MTARESNSRRDLVCLQVGIAILFLATGAAALALPSTAFGAIFAYVAMGLLELLIAALTMPLAMSFEKGDEVSKTIGENLPPNETTIAPDDTRR